MKNWEIGAVTGGISGLAGAWLMGAYGFSLVSVIFVGMLIGVFVGMVFKLIKNKRK